MNDLADQLVHYVSPGQGQDRTLAGCKTALVSGFGHQPDHRYLAVFVPGEIHHRMAVSFDGSTDPRSGTWHQADRCPYQDKTGPALAEHAAPDGRTCALTRPHQTTECTSEPEPDVPVDRNESDRESIISGEFATATLHGYQEAARLVHGGLRDVVWVIQDGVAVAAIIPAREYHPPGKCCCKNCPWGGNHGTA